jgi:hypothetical protein
VRIQRIPTGLLSLLDSKSSLGSTPAELAEVVAGTVNLEPYYLANALTAANASGAVQNAGDLVTQTIPDGEAWRVVGVAGLFGSAFLGTLHMSIAIFPVSSLVELPMLRIGPEVIAAATQIVHQGVMLPEPLVLAPGSKIVARVNTTYAGGVFTLQLRTMYHRLVA